MNFGIFSSAQANSNDLGPETGQGFRDYLDFNVEAEALGFHSSFLVEHHFTGWNQVSSTLMLLMALAMRTRTLRLGSAVMVLPWHNPVLLAEQVATLDLLSGGRFDLGVGKGYRHNEFAGFALPPEEAEPRFAEALDVLCRALSSDAPFSHRGRFWRFDSVLVEPPPHQRPHPPLWMAGSSPRSITDCARRGANLLLDQFASPEQTGARIALYRRELEAAGHQWDPMRVAVARNLWVARDASDKEAALRRQAAAHDRLLALSRGTDSRAGSHILGYSDAPGVREAHALIGTVDEIAARLDVLRAQGAAYLLLSGQGSRENLRLFARAFMGA